MSTRLRPDDDDWRRCLRAFRRDPATEALIAQVIVAKFGDHLPFYRQAAIYARQDVVVDPATLCKWAGRACFHLEPIADQPIICPSICPRWTASSWTKQPRRFSILTEYERRRASSGRSRRHGGTAADRPSRTRVAGLLRFSAFAYDRVNFVDDCVEAPVHPRWDRAHGWNSQLL